MFTRETEIINLIVQVPNSVQPPHALPAVLTVSSAVKIGDQVVGHPQQHQQYLIPGDITPELLGALNSSLAVIGMQLTQIDEQ